MLSGLRTRAQKKESAESKSVYGIRVPHENRLHLILGQRAHGVEIYDKTVLFATAEQKRVMLK
jgi:hypothetical protein